MKTLNDKPKKYRQMIKSREDLKFYLAADAWALGRSNCRPSLTDLTWKYEISLRHQEYNANIGRRFWAKYYGMKKQMLGYILGFTIPKNVFDAGLRLNHHGCIVVNSDCRIGKWCDIHNCVNIGSNDFYNEDGILEKQVPVIGNNVYIAPGAKIFGAVTIGDRSMIGANAVVNIDVPSDSLAVGVPVSIKGMPKRRYLTICDLNYQALFLDRYPQYKKYFD